MIRIPLKGGDEYDMLTKWRKFVCTKPGKAKSAKKKYNKRLRKCLRPLYDTSLVDS